MMARLGRPRGSGIAALDGFAESLRLLLVDEEYTLEDVAMMFGVTRERIRQISSRLGLQDRVKNGGLKCVRLWQDDEHRFRPVHRWIIAATRQVDHHAELVRTREAKYAERWSEAIVALQEMARLLNRSPTTPELLRSLGLGRNPGRLYAYLGVRTRKGCTLSPLWADAGLEMRKSGCGQTRGPRRAGSRICHCRRGHEMTPENTYRWPKPKGGEHRACRTCMRANARKNYAKRTGR